MSKTPNTPVKDTDKLDLDIERLMVSFDEKDVEMFARNPQNFIETNCNSALVRMHATQRLLNLASGLLDHFEDEPNRPEKTIARKIVSALVDSSLEIRDLSILDNESRSVFLDTMLKLGEYSGLKKRGQLMLHLGEISDQLNVDECVKLIGSIGEAFPLYPHGNKANLALGFRELINRLNKEEFDLTVDQQEIVQGSFQSILENGNPQEHEKAFRFLGKYLLITPDLFDQNLDAILESLNADHTADLANGKIGNAHGRFHLFVASYSGRIAEGIRNFAEDVDAETQQERIDKATSIIQALANHEDPDVRIELVDEVAFILRKLDGQDHNLESIIPVLARDSDAGVQAAFNRQVERGFLTTDGLGTLAR